MTETLYSIVCGARRCVYNDSNSCQKDSGSEAGDLTLGADGSCAAYQEPPPLE